MTKLIIFYRTIFRRDKLISDQQEVGNSVQRMSQRKSEQTIMKALKMSLFHVMFFVFSWTPYTIMATW